MKKLCLLSILFVFIIPLRVDSQSHYPDHWSYHEQLEDRREVILSALAGQTWKPGDDYRRRIYLGVVKIYTGIDRENGIRYLRDALDDSVHWGCFNVYSMMDAVLRLGSLLPPDIAAETRSRLAENFGEDKGFTENHKLQYRTARYLYGQTWPDGPVFADGMTPLQARAEAEAWIKDWVDRTVSIGMYEYDSVNYHSLYYLCMTSLYDFSQDEKLKTMSWMMMQVLLADWAPEYLNGNWVGSHSREKYNQVTHTLLNCGVAIPFGYLFFGDSNFHPELEETYYSGLAAVQGFRPLPVIGSIATDRSTPYVHLETKAPRRGIGICTRDIPVWKYTYVTKNYSLSSSYGDISAVENHRWDLTWVSDRDGSTCFFINPSNSAEQLLRYFDSTPDEIVPAITKQRPYYIDPNKWIEGSPYEELCQHENTVIALYDIPEDEINGHVNGFFSKIIEQRVRKENGWIFCDADSIYFAVRPFTNGVWHEEESHFRLTLDNRRTGVLMEVANKSEYDSFLSFQRRITANPLKIDLKNLRVVYKNSNGTRIDFTHAGKRMIDGKQMTYKTWPLFGGPFVNSKKLSKVITIQYGVEKAILDFNDLSIKYEINKSRGK